MNLETNTTKTKKIAILPHQVQDNISDSAY
jgi:hypothetical protein